MRNSESKTVDVPQLTLVTPAILDRQIGKLRNFSTFMFKLKNFQTKYQCTRESLKDVQKVACYFIHIFFMIF